MGKTREHTLKIWEKTVDLHKSECSYETDRNNWELRGRVTNHVYFCVLLWVSSGKSSIFYLFNDFKLSTASKASVFITNLHFINEFCNLTIAFSKIPMYLWQSQTLHRTFALGVNLKCILLWVQLNFVILKCHNVEKSLCRIFKWFIRAFWPIQKLGQGYELYLSALRVR